MRLRVRNAGDTIELDITIPSADPTEVWSFSATQQDFGAVTGAADLHQQGLLDQPVGDQLRPRGAEPYWPSGQPARVQR